jgi:predicted phage replisome organizer
VSEKRLYWLKLKEDFFNQKEIKKLRRIAGGDTFTIIYLKLKLLSLKTNGIIEFTAIGDDLSDELSYAIDEDRENIALTITFLKNHKLIEIGQNNDILISNIGELTGSESSSAERQRRFKERQRLGTKALLGNGEVTQESQDGNAKVTIDNKIIREEDKENKIKEITSNDVIKKKMFVPPTIEEVVYDFESRGKERESAEKFFNYYEANGWMAGKVKMKNWNAAAKNWNCNDNKYKPKQIEFEFEKEAKGKYDGL